MIDIQLTGIFPRSNELIKTTWDYEKGKIGKKDLENRIKQDAKHIIELQVKAGFKYTTDGMLLWQDLFRPFIENVDGITSGPLTRWFDNNTFFRKPIINDKLKTKERFIYKYIQTIPLSDKLFWKAILPGPFTFAKLSSNIYYDDFKKLLLDLSQIFKVEVEDLTNKGISFIQFNEPAITWYKLTDKELDFIKDVYKIITDDLNTKTCIHTYFGDASPVLSSLLDYPVDYIGIDFYSTTFEEIKNLSVSKGLLCGCIDARNSFLENPSNIFSFIKDIKEHMEPKDIIISPNCDLEFLPRNIAEKKVVILGNVLRMLEEKL
ncbi:MAG: hypothetical protein DRP84_10405 [Spirochaetes bacterium]|nr:MAG: hypothetical protein DRP84_10405 [Spirochaetota bacterium]